METKYFVIKLWDMRALYELNAKEMFDCSAKDVLDEIESDFYCDCEYWGFDMDWTWIPIIDDLIYILRIESEDFSKPIYDGKRVISHFGYEVKSNLNHISSLLYCSNNFDIGFDYFYEEGVLDIWENDCFNVKKEKRINLDLSKIHQDDIVGSVTFYFNRAFKYPMKIDALNDIIKKIR